MLILSVDFISFQSMSYCATDELRVNIINQLGAETIVKRIEDPVLLIREKALALVRNLLTQKPVGAPWNC